MADWTIVDDPTAMSDSKNKVNVAHVDSSLALDDRFVFLLDGDDDDGRGGTMKVIVKYTSCSSSNNNPHVSRPSSCSKKCQKLPCCSNFGRTVMTLYRMTTVRMQQNPPMTVRIVESGTVVVDVLEEDVSSKFGTVPPSRYAITHNVGCGSFNCAYAHVAKNIADSIQYTFDRIDTLPPDVDEDDDCMIAPKEKKVLRIAVCKGRCSDENQ
jgi:hypothetical protein